MSDEPKPAGHVDWLDFRFSGLEENELFWLKRETTSVDNPIFRKLNDREALLLESQKKYSLQPTRVVYQKDY